MADCRECGKKIGFLSSFWNGLCSSCNMKLNEKREKEKKLIDKAMKEIKEYMEYSYSLGENSEEHYVDWGSDGLEVYPFGNTKKEPFIFDKDKLINRVIKNNYKVKKVIDKFVESELIRIEADKIKQRQLKRKVREKAEKKLYGKVKTKRNILSEEEKNRIYDKFNNECVVCGKKEGLHIHHKDENPSNNQMNNLVVLCGVCHKKTHMKIR